MLARQLRADALVWLSESPRRHELWLYDSASGAMTARGVPAPPFDETRAAALALSVKTELRKGTLAGPIPAAESAAKTVQPAGKLTEATPLEATLPAEEAEDADPAASEPASEPAAASEAAPSTELSPTAAREARELQEARAAILAEEKEPLPPPVDELDRPRFVISAAAEPYAAPHWRLLLHAGARSGATSLGSTEGRFGVEGRWAPWASPTSNGTFWLGARLDLGLPQTFSNEIFRGEYSELGGGLGVGASVHVNHWLDLGAQVGAHLYTASVSGVREVDNLAAEQTRLGYTVHVRPEVELSLGEFGFVIQPALGTAFARQEYVVVIDEVPQKALEMSPVWWQLGAALRVDID